MTLILIYVVVFGALMIFMTTRGRKRQAAQANAMQSALAIGAEVRTIGGLVGTVTDLTDEYVVVETTPGVKLKFTKQAIAGVIAPEAEAFGAEPDRRGRGVGDRRGERRGGARGRQGRAEGLKPACRDGGRGGAPAGNRYGAASVLISGATDIPAS